MIYLKCKTSSIRTVITVRALPPASFLRICISSSQNLLLFFCLLKQYTLFS